MLCIPYLTQAGPVTMKFRRIDLDPDNPSEGPKYRCLPGDPPRPYNVSALLDPTDVICVTEGEVDALTAEQAFRETGSGLRAVGMPGVSSWRPTFGRLFRGYSVVFGLADADDKGQGSDFMEKLSEEIENFRVVTMPAGHDVNSYVNEAGPQALVDRLEVR